MHPRPFHVSLKPRGRSAIHTARQHVSDVLEPRRPDRGKTSDIVFEDVAFDGSRLTITPQVFTGVTIKVIAPDCVPSNIILRRCQVINYPNTQLLDDQIGTVKVE